ncbi:MAG: hypothetical protein IPL32_02450 [Chloracidobacterium sp.]|nr:hypothetical protein [Chloracidobacterium sp.]
MLTRILRILECLFMLFAAMFALTHLARSQTPESSNEQAKWVWRGTVKSKGLPVEGVLVSTPASMTNGVKTKSDGSFVLPVKRYGDTIFFWHPDYKPFSKAVHNLTGEPIEIAIETAADSTWNVPACSKVKDPENYVGIGLSIRVRVPPETKLRAAFNHGLLYYHVRYGPPGGSWEWLQMMNKPADQIQGEYLLEGAPDQRIWKSGSGIGIDRKSDGYRFVGDAITGNFIKFGTGIKEADALFSAMVDTLCFEQNLQRSYLSATGSIKGKIFTSGIGHIPNALVELEPLRTRQAQPYSYETYVNRKGYFQFGNLPAGKYVLKTSDMHRNYKRVIRVTPGKTVRPVIRVLPVTKKRY